MLVLVCILLPLSARYQLCNFSCTTTDERWLACRSEKCSPRLPEDACADGAEAELLPAFGSQPEDAPNGFAVSGPQQCEMLLAPEPEATRNRDVEASSPRQSPPPPPLLRVGSFAERCELCMGVVSEAVDIMRLALSGNGRAALETGGAAATCEQAVARLESTLPSVRTCRLHPPACAAVLAAARERACPQTFEQVLATTSPSRVRAAQQKLCGYLMTQRNGSGVGDAVECAVPRDVGARVMAISAVVATVLFVAQWFRV